MRLSKAIRTWLVGVVVISFVAVACVVRAESPEAAIPLDQLSAACKKAKGDFHPITPADVEAAKTSLVEALDRLDARLQLDGANGEAWQKYLHLDALRQELSANRQPEKDVLAGIYARFTAQEDGLELVWFLDVQRALRSYMFAATFSDTPQMRAAYDAMLDKLAAAVEAQIAKPTPESAAVIGEILGRLRDTRQNVAVAAQIDRHFANPNLFAQLSSNVVGAGIVDCVDDVSQIRDCILGTDVCATAHTIGQTCVEMVPDPNCGVIDTLFTGTTVSESIGWHHPVTVCSSSTTNLSARKRLRISADGLCSEPAVASAQTAICVHDIQSDKGRRMVEKMAWKRSGKQQGEAEAVASAHAEARLDERIDAQAAESLDKANNSYVEKFQRPFNERKLFPESLRFSTSERSLDVTALQAGGGKLAAPGVPPTVVDGADMSLRVHESMINNLAHDAIAGRIVHEEKVQAAVTNLLGYLPEKMKGDEDGQPFAITFAEHEPISVRFADDGFKVTIRGVEYRKGNNMSKAMNITATYKIEQTDGRFKAVRQGEIEVFPPDFVPGQGRQLDAQREIMRTLLKRRFAKVFEPEFLGEGLELPGRWKAAGKMMPIEVVCRDGWLTIAWKRAAEVKAK